MHAAFSLLKVQLIRNQDFMKRPLLNSLVGDNAFVCARLVVWLQDSCAGWRAWLWVRAGWLQQNVLICLISYQLILFSETCWKLMRFGF